jgi:uncharacterized protein YecE (DUF72 family)
MPKARSPGLFIGTSGWAYDNWRDGFYAGVPRARWLAHYAQHFDAVEVNATFYHSLKAKTFEHWHDATPPRFRFAIKGSRYLTHILRLDFPAESLAKQRDAAAPLAEKLLVVLWQLPAALHRDDALLAKFAEKLRAWPGPRHALEFRHASWFDDKVAALLAREGLASVQSDAADWPMWDAVTAALVYARLHGHAQTYHAAYGKRELSVWARRVTGWLADGREVHVYFDNTDAGHAVHDAQALRRLLDDS